MHVYLPIMDKFLKFNKLSTILCIGAFDIFCHMYAFIDTATQGEYKNKGVTLGKHTSSPLE